MGLANAANKSSRFAHPVSELRPIGQIDLIDDEGGLINSWQVRFPKCTIGSSPDCAICIPDPSIAKLHATLIFGKRHTLLKAFAIPTKILDRNVREWLIDKPTKVTIGSFQIIVHPAPCVATVVQADQLAKIAETLRSSTQKNSSPSNNSLLSSDTSQENIVAVHQQSEPLQPTPNPSDESFNKFVETTEKTLESIQSQINVLQSSIETIHSSVSDRANSHEPNDPIESRQAIIESVSNELSIFGNRWFIELNATFNSHRDQQEQRIESFASNLQNRLMEMDHRLKSISQTSLDESQRFHELIKASRTENQSIVDRLDNWVADRDQLFQSLVELRNEVSQINSAHLTNGVHASVEHAPVEHVPYPNASSNVTSDHQQAFYESPAEQVQPHGFIDDSAGQIEYQQAEYVESTEALAPGYEQTEHEQTEYQQTEYAQPEHEPSAYEEQPAYEEGAHWESHDGTQDGNALYESGDQVAADEYAASENGYLIEEPDSSNEPGVETIEPQSPEYQHEAAYFDSESDSNAMIPEGNDGSASYDYYSNSNDEYPRDTYDEPQVASESGPREEPVDSITHDHEKETDESARSSVEFEQLPAWFTGSREASEGGLTSNEFDSQPHRDQSDMDSSISDEDAEDFEGIRSTEDSISERLTRMLADADTRRQTTRPKFEPSNSPRRWSEVFKDLREDSPEEFLPTDSEEAYDRESFEMNADDDSYAPDIAINHPSSTNELESISSRDSIDRRDADLDNLRQIEEDRYGEDDRYNVNERTNLTSYATDDEQEVGHEASHSSLMSAYLESNDAENDIDKDIESNVEADHRYEDQESASEEEMVQEQAIDEIAAHDNSDEGEGGPSEEESIEDYMQRLLQRVRTGSDQSSTGPVANKKVAKVTTPVVKNTEKAEAPAIERKASTATPLPVAKPKELFVPRQQAPERKIELSAMREIANDSARRALESSDTKRGNAAFFFKLAVTAVAVTTAALLFLINGVKLNAPFAGMIAALVTAGLWGYDCINHFKKSKTNPPQDTPPEPASQPVAQPQAPVAMQAEHPSVTLNTSSRNTVPGPALANPNGAVGPTTTQGWRPSTML